MTGEDNRVQEEPFIDHGVDHVEYELYDDGGKTDSEVIIALDSIEFVVTADKLGQRVFWRRPGETGPRGQLAGRGA